jgi:uncharacterized protein
MATPSSNFPNFRELIAGDAGAIEVASHVRADFQSIAVAVVAHPHPLFGGTMDNKVVTTLARTLFDAGAAVYRFNFRGVGASEGVHDDARGECDDMLRVIAHALTKHPAKNSGAPLWLAGFSFGGAVTLAASTRLAEIASDLKPSQMVLVAPSLTRLHDQSILAAAPPESTLIVHGELDETVPLIESFGWARTHNLPVTVLPGAEHFFHQRLHILKRIVARHVAGGRGGAVGSAADGEG